jgi:hypothetical protein
MGYFACIVIGVCIGYITCAMFTQSKYAEEHEQLVQYYNNLLKAQCLICPFKSGQ